MAVENGAPSVDLLSYVFENTLDDQDKPVLIDANNPSRFLTARTARRTVKRLIAGLRAEGFERGDCLCLHSFNDIYYPLIYLAVIGVGGVFTGSNPAYTSLELNHHVRTSHAKYLVAEPHVLATATETARECGIPDSRLFVFDSFDKEPYEPCRPWEDLLEHGEEDWVRFSQPEEKDTVAMLGFTSGTTGLPKAAMITHNYAVSQIWAIESRGKPYDVSRLLCLPAFHAFALPLIIGCPLRERHSMYLMRRFDLKQYLDLIERFAVTETAMVPAMIYGVLKSPLATRESLKSLRYMWCAGSPLRKSTQEDFQALISSEAKISQVWGLTEVGWATAMFWPEGDDSGSVGRPIPGLTVRLLDEEGNPIEEENREGEMLLKGPAMMLGYLDNPEATAEMINEEGWLRTGDIGYSQQGKYYVIDRKKDLIKVRGWQVAPAEIEAVLLTHPQIIGAAVLGVPDAQGTGELPRAFVIRKPRIYNAAAASYGIGGKEDQKDVTEDDIKEFIAERLARYKYLDGGVQFVKEIPRNASGKVLKPKLRALSTVAEADNGVKDATVSGSFHGVVKERHDGITISGTLDGIVTTVTEMKHETPDGTIDEILAKNADHDSRIVVGPDQHSAEHLPTIIDNSIINTSAQAEGNDNENPKSPHEHRINGHIEGILNGSHQAVAELRFDGKTVPWSDCHLNEQLDTMASSRRIGYTDKFIDDAIANMKQSLQEHRNTNMSTGSSRKTNGVVGEKRQHSGMLTRQAKRQSLNMTAR